MPAGRPPELKPEYCQMVIDHMSEGASLTSFAASIGVARSTIGYWARNYPEFEEAKQIAKAKCAAWWERHSRQGATGENPIANATLIIFNLKNLASDDFKDRHDHAHTSPDGSMTPQSVDPAIVSALVNKLTD